MKTISQRNIDVEPNYENNTFTITVDGDTKYITTEMTQEEFDECEMNTVNDWQNFLNTSGNYYKA